MAPFLHLDVIGLAELSALLCQQEGNLLGQLLGGMNGHRLVSSQLPAPVTMKVAGSFPMRSSSSASLTCSW